MKKTLITGGSIISEKAVELADVLISATGTIEKISANIQDHKGTEVIDAKGFLLFPLLIDCHVHFREPGLEHKATMESEAAAALSGGIGCVCDMPNTMPPTVTVAALADKVRRASHIDGCAIKFFFGVTEPLHLVALRDLWTGSSLECKRLKHHCAGAKIYFDHSTGNQKIDTEIVEETFRTCAELKAPLVAHCEDAGMNSRFEVRPRSAEALREGKSSKFENVSAHSLQRPPESEGKSIADAISLVRKYNTPFHVAHLSTEVGLEQVRNAKKEKLPVTCEVAPHHLFLTIEDYATLGTLGKMNPPLRSREDQAALWGGISDGTIDCIATDHAPHTLEEKKASDWRNAPSGVPGVETMLPLLLNAAAEKKMGYTDIVRLCFTNPNRIFSLHQPAIEEGSKARIVLVDPRESRTILRSDLKTKCAWSPFEGCAVQGKIVRVMP